MKSRQFEMIMGVICLIESHSIEVAMPRTSFIFQTLAVWYLLLSPLIDCIKWQCGLKKFRSWHRAPMAMKRLNGFLCYQVSAFAALLYPVQVDNAMRDTLNDQFEKEMKDICQN